MARLIIPPRLLAIDIIGTVLAAIGLAGLFTDVSSILPFMADKHVAGMIAAAGFQQCEISGNRFAPMGI